MCRPLRHLGVSPAGQGAGENLLDNPAPDWVVGRAWTDICQMGTIACFKGIAAEFGAAVASWREYFDCKDPHQAKLPGRWNDLNSLQKMCVCRSLRPDKSIDAMQA